MPTTDRTAPAAADLNAAVDVLRLLADRTRLAILALLETGEMGVGALADTLERPVPAVSQHLAKLRSGNLVTSRREGTAVFYALSNPHVSALVTNALQHGEHLRYPVPPHHR